MLFLDVCPAKMMRDYPLCVSECLLTPLGKPQEKAITTRYGARIRIHAEHRGWGASGEAHLRILMTGCTL